MQPYVTEAAAKKEEIQKLLSDVRSNQNLKPRAPAYVSRPFSLQRSFSGHALPLYAGYRLWLYVRVCTHTPYRSSHQLVVEIVFSRFVPANPVSLPWQAGLCAVRPGSLPSGPLPERVYGGGRGLEGPQREREAAIH